MPKYAVNIVIVVVLAVVAIFAVYVLLVRGLISPDLPLPEGGAKFLRYLSCAYAMCAKGCDSDEVIDIWLDEEKGGCNDVCNKMGSNRLCGRNYALKLEIDRSFTYYSNYLVTMHDFLGNPKYSMQTDVMKIKKWHETIQKSSECFWGALNSITLDGFTVDGGCMYQSAIAENYIAGMCEGSLRSSSGCNKGNTPTGVGGSKTVGTGHIWIDPVITSQCVEFKTEEGRSSGTKYYGSCAFKDQIIYIWSEPDGPCPEIVICNTP